MPVLSPTSSTLCGQLVCARRVAALPLPSTFLAAVSVEQVCDGFEDVEASRNADKGTHHTVIFVVIVVLNARYRDPGAEIEGRDEDCPVPGEEPEWFVLLNRVFEQERDERHARPARRAVAAGE